MNIQVHAESKRRNKHRQSTIKKLKKERGKESSKEWRTSRHINRWADIRRDERNKHRENPGLVVMGGDSCTEGRGFDSQHCILDGHCGTFICCKNCHVCLKRRK